MRLEPFIHKQEKDKSFPFSNNAEAQPLLSPLSSFLPLICIILLFRSPCVAEERRATAGGLMIKETYVVLTCYKAQHPGPIAH